MYRDIIKKNRYVRTLAFRYRNWRENRSFTSGSGHKIEKKGVCVNSIIQISGDNNSVLLDNDSVHYRSKIKINGQNNRVILHIGAYLSGTELYIEDSNCTIEIGSNTYIGHHSHLACTEDGSTLKIGSQCMLSSYVQVRTGDSHSILDMEGHRINPAASVKIDDHCWLGEGCKVLKGVSIGCDSVVSTGAVVTKSFGRNVLVGGVPAKVLKEDIEWSEKRL